MGDEGLFGSVRTLGVIVFLVLGLVSFVILLVGARAELPTRERLERVRRRVLSPE